jgi:adenylate cyclase, class 2
MKRHDEIEVKLKVKNRQELKRRLKAAGFTVTIPRVHERNVLYDFRDRSLTKANCAVRLRSAGGRHWLTFKGNPNRSHQYKVREEIETAVEDAEQLKGILSALGLQQVFAYEKHRTTYTSKPPRARGKVPTVVFDETAAGDYVELEGPRRWIDRLASQLGFDKGDYITASYVRLLSALPQRARGKATGVSGEDAGLLAAIPASLPKRKSRRCIPHEL